MLKELLTKRLTGTLEIDNPDLVELRKSIIAKNRFLKEIYLEWYQMIIHSIPDINGGVVELGSGAGFLRNYIPDLISSDIVYCSEISLVLDGQRLPFSDHSLSAIVMVDVFHHLPNPKLFLSEATRCIKIGGSIVMIEPWVTAWSRFIFGYLHHEPFFPESREWGFVARGPLSGANSAQAWIVFKRDKEKFLEWYPQWQLVKIVPFMPFRYLFSGGMSYKPLLPNRSFVCLSYLESLLNGFNHHLGLFAHITLRKMS